MIISEKLSRRRELSQLTHSTAVNRLALARLRLFVRASFETVNILQNPGTALPSSLSLATTGASRLHLLILYSLLILS